MQCRGCVRSVCSSGDRRRVCLVALTHTHRTLRYSPFDNLRASSQSKSAATKATTTTTASSRLRRREYRERALQSPVEARAEAAMIFPTTLSSGRYAQQNTIAQCIAYADRSVAKAVLEQRARDRAYAAALRAAKQHDNAVDRRFVQPLRDYRDIVDTDPNSDVFGESRATQQLRIAAWQQQFERENAHVVLPYERTSWLRRRAPNWFVRSLLDVRDRGGYSNVVVSFVMLALAATAVTAFLYAVRSRDSDKQAPISEVR